MNDELQTIDAPAFTVETSVMPAPPSAPTPVLPTMMPSHRIMDKHLRSLLEKTIGGQPRLVPHRTHQTRPATPPSKNNRSIIFLTHLELAQWVIDHTITREVYDEFVLLTGKILAYLEKRYPQLQDTDLRFMVREGAPYRFANKKVNTYLIEFTIVPLRHTIVMLGKPNLVGEMLSIRLDSANEEFTKALGHSLRYLKSMEVTAS